MNGVLGELFTKNYHNAGKSTHGHAANREKGECQIDVLFASAGVDELIKPLGSITAKGFKDTLNVNVRGPSLQYKRQRRS